MNPLTLDEIKAIELDILKNIHEVCNRHGLRYYLSYGTLLGAVRHKGFIPWDDDIDIVMPREDYEKLLPLIGIETSYKSLIPGEDDYYYEFAKVVDSTTYIPTNNIEPIKWNGVWVDIFPMDGFDEKNKKRHKMIYWLNRIRVGAVYKTMPPCPSAILKPFYYLFWKISRMIGYKRVLKREIELSKRVSYDNSKLVGFTAEIDALNNQFPREWFEKTVQIPFEGHLFNAPAKYHEYLTYLYGDYMQLPPEDKREAHCITAYKR